VLDYKTADKRRLPASAHIGPADAEETLPEARIPAGLLGRRGGRDQRWADLQLPLYREMVRRGAPNAVVQVGYICLTAAVGETAFAIWEEYNEALHAHALACARAVQHRIRAGIFWPPRKFDPGFQDDLAGVLLNDPERTIEPPPPPPWRMP
jgi:hypothetical protein